MSSINHFQERVRDRLTEEHGRVHVRDGYTDEHVELTFPRGVCVYVSKLGLQKNLPADHSVDWRYES